CPSFFSTAVTSSAISVVVPPIVREVTHLSPTEVGKYRAVASRPFGLGAAADGSPNTAKTVTRKLAPIRPQIGDASPVVLRMSHARMAQPLRHRTLSSPARAEQVTCHPA